MFKFQDFIGARIHFAKLVHGHQLVLAVGSTPKTPGAKLYIYDDGHQCCEHRWMSTDDDVEDLIHGELIDIKIKPVKNDPTAEDICFVEVVTTKGSIVLVTHNEHDGYYGGFDLRVDVRLEVEFDGYVSPEDVLKARGGV